MVVCLESDLVESNLDSEADRSLRPKGFLHVVGTQSTSPASHQPRFVVSKCGLAVENMWVWTQV